MSPLRRVWLAWAGWELATTLVLLGLLGLLAGFKIGVVGGEFPTVAERPFAFVVLVTLPLGLRLRSLLMVDCLAMARDHTTWVMRWFCLAILPLVSMAIAVPLALTGVPLLWSVAIGASLAAAGAWIGFAIMSIMAFAVGFGLAGLLGLVTERSGLVWDALALAALVAVTLAVRLAWRRLEARTVCAPSIRSWWFLERIADRFDALLMRPPPTAVVSGRLPSKLTAFRVGLSGLGGSWRLRLIGMLLMAVGACILSSQAKDLRDRLPMALCVSTLIAGVVAPSWLTAGGIGERHARGQARRLIRGLLASQRLLPLPRRLAAAATMLSLIGHCLVNVLPIAAGMLLGLLVSDAWQGRDAAGLWLVLPQAVSVGICSAAGMLLLVTMPIAVAIAGGMLLVVLLLGAPLVVLHAGSEGYPSATLIAAGLAALLAPLAWWRLSEAELP